MLTKKRVFPAKSTKHIFISYRREDTSGEVGRLIDSFKGFFDEKQVFRDINKLEPGVNFTEAIPKYLNTSSVFLVVIGPKWLGPKADGSFRINSPDDWVRIELHNALQKNIPVVPILVDEASLPKEHDLPDELKPFLNHQKYEISDLRWNYDVEQLAYFLVTTYKIPSKEDASWQYTKPGAGKIMKLRVFYLLVVFVVAILLAIILMKSSDDTYKQPSLSKKQKDSLEIALGLARWCEETGRNKQALEYYREAQKITGDDPEIIEKINTIQKQIQN